MGVCSRAPPVLPSPGTRIRRDTSDWWFVPAGALTGLAILAAFLALDDITTARASAAEYVVLGLGALWGIGLAAALARLRHRLAAAVCIAAFVPGFFFPMATLSGFMLVAVYLIGRGWGTFART